MSYNTKFEDKITEKGTRLPLLNLKGKPYLQVAHRLVWFRERYPEGLITTTIVQLKEDSVVVKAEIYSREIGNPQAVLLAVAHKMETKSGFPDFIEKAETGAIGRALAIVGLGTQFEPEFDEGERLADAPVDIAKKTDAKVDSAVERRSAEGIAQDNAAGVKKMATFKRQSKAEAPVAKVAPADSGDDI